VIAITLVLDVLGDQMYYFLSELSSDGLDPKDALALIIWRAKIFGLFAAQMAVPQAHANAHAAPTLACIPPRHYLPMPRECRLTPFKIS
jgi:hypothetical protein